MRPYDVALNSMTLNDHIRLYGTRHTRPSGGHFVTLSADAPRQAQRDLYRLSDYAVSTAGAAGCYWMVRREQRKDD